MEKKRKTTPGDNAFLIRNSKLDPGKRSFDPQKDLQHCELQISATTLRRRLLEVGRKAMKPLTKHVLTKTIKQNQIVWAKKYNWFIENWKKVLFSDETYFFVQEWHGKNVSISEEENLSPMHFTQTAIHSQKKMFWNCFSFPGVETLTPVEEMTNLNCHTELIRRTVTRDMQRSFPADGGILQ